MTNKWSQCYWVKRIHMTGTISGHISGTCSRWFSALTLKLMAHVYTRPPDGRPDSWLWNYSPGFSYELTLQSYNLKHACLSVHYIHHILWWLFFSIIMASLMSRWLRSHHQYHIKPSSFLFNRIIFVLFWSTHLLFRITYCTDISCSSLKKILWKLNFYIWHPKSLFNKMIIKVLGLLSCYILNLSRIK